MTIDQLMFLRFLRMKAEFPELKHDGHEPGLPIEYGHTTRLVELEQQWGRRRAEIEFYRPIERMTP